MRAIAGHQHAARCVISRRTPARTAYGNAAFKAQPLSRIVDRRHNDLLPRPRSQYGRPSRPFSHNAGYTDPTIYALSSASGRAAIAVIRVSGPASLEIYRKLCPDRPLPKPRVATVRKLYAPNHAPTAETVLDSSALILYFPSPRTATGEAILELHVHGGPATVRAVLAAIPQCASTSPIRYAEPGEFTRRAFLHDRLDLTQVEALGDTLAATTEQQRRLSVRGTGSSLATRYEEWRRQLLHARGELEALIDFSEDQHFDESPAALCASVAVQVRVLQRKLAVHARNAVRGELLRNGIGLSFLGAPNVGKSSLLNRIVGREAAIVSQEAGTTRDVVEVGLDLGGYFCRLGDTAGLRKAKEAAGSGAVASEMIGQIEKEGMRRAKERAAESDVVVVVLSFETDTAGRTTLNLDPEVVETAQTLVADKDNVLVAINKTDRVQHDPAELAKAIEATLAALPGLTRNRIHPISCHPRSAPNTRTTPLTSQQDDPGKIQTFLHALITHFASLTSALAPAGESDPDPSIWQESLGATERHRGLLEQSTTALDAFLEEVASDTGGAESLDAGTRETDIVVAAEHLREAAQCLAKITGRGEGGDVEEVLGVVFEKFCVGK